MRNAYFEIFDHSNIIALSIQNDRITNMNQLAKDILGGEKTIIEYIINNAKSNSTFDLFAGDEFYRMVTFSENDGSKIIIGVPITDLKTNEANVRRKIISIERKLEELSAFSDLLIHDIKNYIFICDGYLTLIKSGKVKEKYFRDLKKIIDQVRELLMKASLLLKDSESSIKKEKVNLKKMLDEIIKNFRLKAEEKKIKIVKNYDTKYVLADPLIREVFMNVIDNAIKYSPDNSKIVVEVKEFPENVIVRVMDEGVGIPDQFKTAIFERFKRRSTDMGMGLGLAVSKRIVEMNGGRIYIEDNTPKGCIFNIELPKK